MFNPALAQSDRELDQTFFRALKMYEKLIISYVPILLVIPHNLWIIGDLTL